MLNEIFISNFAIIERTCANFENGLNIITGETGAGKSIIIEAVELLLGARANKDLIGSYSDSAVVEGVFNLSENIRTRLHEEFGIEVLEDFVIVTREIYKNGKSIARINGRQTNLSTIKDIMSSVIDIHSQHSSQILLDKKNYIEIIDSLADDKFDEELSKLDLLLSNKREILREIDKLDIDPSETQRRIDVLQYQISEISSFHLDNLNFDEVVIEHRKLSNSHDISKSMQKIKSFFLSEGYDSKDISSLVSSSIGELNSILKYDDSLNSILKQLVDLESIVNDLKFEIIDYHDSLSDNEERLFELDSIITSIENLKRKYGDSIEKILSFEQEARKELDSYQKKDENLINLKLLLKDIENKIHTKAKHISDIRKANASKFEKAIQSELKQLNFDNSIFKVVFSEKNIIDKKGMDDINFLASFNLGQNPRSLFDIASGGELSRFMLALKIITAEKDTIDTLILDEIDTGVSGITAQVVGEVISKLAQNYQILLVTHLPQIAVRGKHHILIDKYTENGLTKTSLKVLNYDERINEVARLIGGKNITKSVLASATEQLNSAQKE